jgi:two-component system, cell cycle sensor histidine kinase and response regulator CckA
MCLVANSSAQGQIRVLLVDDEPLVRNFLRILLEKQRNYRVLAAASGEEALGLLRQCPDRIDMLVTDFEIGDMNGIQLYTQLLRERPGTAVLFVSADADVFRESYPDWPFLKKPFVLKDFVGKLKEVHSTQFGDADALPC